MSTALAENQNMKFWKEYSVSDPAYIKDVAYGAGLSSIDGYYLFMKATEAFGMCGIGWGYDILEEEMRTGAPIYDKNKVEILGHEIDHTLRLKLWYMVGEKRGELTHFGITKFVYSTKYGMATDEEAPKKSLTDAIKKCLSMLGFSSDVYLGKFEDDWYRDYASKVAELKKSDEYDDKIKEEIKILSAWVGKEINGISKISSLETYKKAMRTLYTKITSKCELLGIDPNEWHEQITNLVNEAGAKGDLNHAS